LCLGWLSQLWQRRVARGEIIGRSGGNKCQDKAGGYQVCGFANILHAGTGLSLTEPGDELKPQLPCDILTGCEEFQIRNPKQIQKSKIGKARNNERELVFGIATLDFGFRDVIAELAAKNHRRRKRSQDKQCSCAF
jgi:hypothetical protein